MRSKLSVAVASVACLLLVLSAVPAWVRHTFSADFGVQEDL